MTAADPVRDEAVRAALERILSSKTFTASGSLSNFLRHVVDQSLAGRAAELKEYTVGCEVFGRGSSFDPKTDTIVRVQASRLRVKLREYYAGEGEQDGIVISVPQGGYAPQFLLKDGESTAAPTPPPAPKTRTRVWMTIAGAAALLLGAAALFSRLPAPREQTVLEQVTNDLGLSTDPALSPDGKLVAYASDRNTEGHTNIWIQQLASGGTAMQLTSFEADADQPAFSPDGHKVVFRVTQAGGGLYVAPAIGGEPVQIASFGRDPRFSPDGKSIAFWHGIDVVSRPGVDPSGRVFVVSASGGKPVDVGPAQTGYPVWSPDSRNLLVSRILPESKRDWWVVPVSGEEPVRTSAFQVLRQQGFTIDFGSVPRPAAWLRDSVVFSARFGDSTNVWEMGLFPGKPEAFGRARRLTSGTGSEVAPSVAADGRIVFAGLTERTAIWSVPLNPNRAQQTGPSAPVTRSTDSEMTHSMTPDGRYVAYSTQASKDPMVSVKNLQDGKLLSLGSATQYGWRPVISRDSSRLAYANWSEAPGTYTMSLPSGPAIKVSDSKSYSWDWSRDNQRLLLKKSHQHREIWSIDFSTNIETVFLSRGEAFLYQAKYAPDDRWVAVEAVTTGTSHIYVVPLENGLPAKDRPWVRGVGEDGWADKPRWSPDGQVLYFVSDRDGFRCVWAQRLDPVLKQPIGSPTAVYHSHGGRFSMMKVPISLSELEIARDRMLISVGEVSGNIWSLRGLSSPASH